MKTKNEIERRGRALPPPYHTVIGVTQKKVQFNLKVPQCKAK